MRKLGLLKASLFAASAMLLANPAAAQPGDDHGDIAQAQADAQEETPATPRDPNAISGSIAEPTSAKAEHRVQLEAGRRYFITVDAESFDAVARLMRPGSTEPLAEDDDSGGGTNGTNPRIVFTPQTSGEYIVEVRSFAASGFGEYALSVTPQAPLPALVTRPTRTERGNWQVFDGELAASDATEGGRKYDDYQLTLRANESVMLHARAAGETDLVLQVFTVDERGISPIVENDDADGVNPFLFFSPGEEGGNFVVRVIGFDGEAAGRYNLRIGR